MTPDTTQPDTTQTKPVTEPVTAETEKLREVIERARFVLFDFDGPICRLFAGHSAEDVAKDLVGWLEGQGLRGLLSEKERVHPDPHVVLRVVNKRHPHSDLVAELEELLTQHELKAVPSAWPTPFADPLIRTWTAVGVRLAVATNNSPAWCPVTWKAEASPSASPPTSTAAPETWTTSSRTRTASTEP